MDRNKTFCFNCLSQVDSTHTDCAFTFDNLLPEEEEEEEDDDDVGSIQQNVTETAPKRLAASNCDVLQEKNQEMNVLKRKPDVANPEARNWQPTMDTFSNIKSSSYLSETNNTRINRSKNTEYGNTISGQNGKRTHYDPAQVYYSENTQYPHTNPIVQNSGQTPFGSTQQVPNATQSIERYRHLQEYPRSNFGHNAAANYPSQPNTIPNFRTAFPNISSNVLRKDKYQPGYNYPQQNVRYDSFEPHSSMKNPNCHYPENLKNSSNNVQQPAALNYVTWDKKTVKKEAEFLTQKKHRAYEKSPSPVSKAKISIEKRDDEIDTSHNRFVKTYSPSTKQKNTERSAQQESVESGVHHKNIKSTNQKKYQKKEADCISEKITEKEASHNDGQQRDAMKSAKPKNAKIMQQKDNVKSIHHEHTKKEAADNDGQQKDAMKSAQPNNAKNIQQKGSMKSTEHEHAKKEAADNDGQHKDAMKNAQPKNAENIHLKGSVKSIQHEHTKQEAEGNDGQQKDTMKSALPKNAKNMQQKDSGKSTEHEHAKKEAADNAGQQRDAMKSAQPKNAKNMQQKDSEKSIQHENAEESVLEDDKSLQSNDAKQKDAQLKEGKIVEEKSNKSIQQNIPKNADKPEQKNIEENCEKKKEDAKNGTEQENVPRFTGEGYKSIEEFIEALYNGTLYKRY